MIFLGFVFSMEFQNILIAVRVFKIKVFNIYVIGTYLCQI